MIDHRISRRNIKYNFEGMGGSLGPCGLSEIYLVTKQAWELGLPIPFNARVNASCHDIVTCGENHEVEWLRVTL